MTSGTAAPRSAPAYLRIAAALRDRIQARELLRMRWCHLSGSSAVTSG